MTSDPIVLQQQLAALLGRVDTDARLQSEMSRARREFFGSAEPGPHEDAAAEEAAAQRFVEWFLLERPSDVLGEPPIRVLPGAEGDALAPLRDSFAGLFMVEAGGNDLLVRDLEDGQRLNLRGAVVELRAGDLLVGRLFPVDDDHVPSAVTIVIQAAPQLAVAFQRDIRNLRLGRRLSQAEIEHLVVRHLAAQPTGALPEIGGAIEPVEHLEAELHTLLEAAGLLDEYDATAVSRALRDSAGPGGVIGPLMDLAAIDSDVDLEQLRQVLLRLYQAQLAARLRDGEPRPSPVAPAPDPAPPERPAPVRPRPGEGLGEALARRIEAGLSAGENVEALFRDCEQMLGESIDDDDDSQSSAVDDGNLAAFVREFIWETGASAAEESVLLRLAAAQRDQPVSKPDIESLEADDFSRFLLEVWLGAPPVARLRELTAAFGVLERFCGWVATNQLIDVEDRLAPARTSLVDDAERLDAIGRGLSQSARGPRGSRVLLRVLDATTDRLQVEGTDRPQRFEVPLPPDLALRVHPGDLLFADLVGEPRDQRLAGMIVAVPGALEALLGS